MSVGEHEDSGRGWGWGEGWSWRTWEVARSLRVKLQQEPHGRHAWRHRSCEVGGYVLSHRARE